MKDASQTETMVVVAVVGQSVLLTDPRHLVPEAGRGSGVLRILEEVLEGGELACRGQKHTRVSSPSHVLDHVH